MINIMSSGIVDTFAGLPHHAVRAAAGDCLFRRGDPVRSVFLLQAGRVELVRFLESGKKLTLHTATGGSVIAEASLYSDHYHCDAVCVEASMLVRVPRSKMRRRLMADPALADAWAAHLAASLQSARTRSELLTTRTIAERLDGWLALHGGIIPQKGYRKALAAELGVTPEALYRELAKRRIGS